MPRVILVTGATGHVGRQVVSQLLGTGAAVCVLVRTPNPVSLPEVMRGDLTLPNTLDQCLNGVEAVFLVWPALPVDFAPAVLEAVSNHARRILYLSSLIIRGNCAGSRAKVGKISGHLPPLPQTAALSLSHLWRNLQCSAGHAI